MNSFIIDTHCHLYLEDFKNNIDDILQRAREAGVKQFYLPAIDSATHQLMIDLSGKYPSECIPMMGLHPCSVRENYKEELNVANEWINKKKFAAIGEIGLDYYWDTSFKDQQVEAFNIQINWALENQLPIVIHSRNSLDDCIKIVEENQNGNLNGIFHCFSGSREQAEEIIGLGFYLGIGGVLTYKNAGLAEVVAELPLEKIVLETDAPYLTPVPFRGKRNESSYLKYVIEKLADLKSVTEEEVARITTANAQNIFGD
jgi:TatD DNase family protein